MHFNCKSFYNENDYDDNNEEIKEENEEIELRKNVEDGKYFKVIIQTYNHLIKDMEEYHEMTIGELKDIIEKKFMVSKEHQELLYKTKWNYFFERILFPFSFC